VQPTLKFFEEGGKAQGQQDGRQGRALSHPNARGELWGEIIVPGIMAESIYKVIFEEHNLFWHEPLVIQDGEEVIMIDGREELS
jgi:hypothetical protein